MAPPSNDGVHPSHHRTCGSRIRWFIMKLIAFYTTDYKEYAGFIFKKVSTLNCKITDLEIDDNHIDYEHM